MAASPTIASQLDPAFEIGTLKEYEPKPKPAGLKRRLYNLMIEIFEGHLEYLGWTPD